jgi:hypothetical protein
MLSNELTQIAELVRATHSVACTGTGMPDDEGPFDLLHLQTLCSKAREAWAFAAFERASDESLKRYFTYHMTVLRELTDGSGSPEYDQRIVAELTLLADHLFTYHQRFLESNAELPRALVRITVEGLNDQITLIKENIECRVADASLRLVLSEALREILHLPDRSACSVGSLRYAGLFITEVRELLCKSPGDEATSLLTDKLISINFNHIRFFLYLEDELNKTISKLTIQDQLGELQHQRNLFRQLNPSAAYAANWSPVGEMMCCWLTEKIGSLTARYQQTMLKHAAGEKLGFNLSVAQLACLTKAFFNAGIYLSERITDTLSFSARHFYSKKQRNISRGSFSKEYYSVSQKTAAQVLDLLQKMAANIRRDYFPVFLVTGAMHLFLSGTCLTH